jgi:uncharacterized LabA/DUF88 family protein
MSTYLFIDGGYLREKYSTCMLRYYQQDLELAFAKVASAAASLARADTLQKVFYYDCVDERTKPGESEQEFKSRSTAQGELFNKIRDLPGWHVREGRLVGARKDNRRQKRVDVLLTVDMLSHAFNKNMQTAVLIAGDDDFTPLVDELLRHGSYVIVLSDRRSGSQHLGHTADASRHMDFPFYWSLAPSDFQKEHALPDDAQTTGIALGRIVKFGTNEHGQSVKVFENPNGFSFGHYTPGVNSRFNSIVRSAELRVLEEYLHDFHKDLLPPEWHQPNHAGPD